MRIDIAKHEALARCAALKAASFWPPEPRMRPGAWLSNFDEQDLPFAIGLLEKFTFYGASLTDALLVSAFRSVGDGLEKGPAAPARTVLEEALRHAIFTPVRGETPNPADSGHLFCRKARQLLHIPDNRMFDTADAINSAKAGTPIVFVDDFIGSGDQFLSTWTAPFDQSGASFETVHATSPFTVIYITLVATDYGIGNINARAPAVAVCPTHILERKSTIYEAFGTDPQTLVQIDSFLKKYATKLRPTEHWIATNIQWLKYGYKGRGLMLGFDHSIPDATLPIFWSPGIDEWEPLIERN